MVSPAISSSLKMHKFGSNLAQIIPPQNYLSIIGPPYFLLLKVYNNLGYSLFIFESIPVLKKIMVHLKVTEKCNWLTVNLTVPTSFFP